MREKRSGPDGCVDLPAGRNPTAGESLRRRAEAISRGQPEDVNLETRSPEAVQRLLHELRVQQIELEIQNEELRRVQGELEASRARYFDLYDLAPVGYLTLSEEGLIREINLTGAHLLGTGRDALMGQPLTRFIAREDQDVCYHHCRELFRTRTPQVWDMRMAHADGSRLWVRVDATAAQEGEHGTCVCRAVVSDITERRRVEEKRVLAERLAALGRAVTTVSHEIRNPLGVIRNSLFSVGERVRGQDESVDKALARAERSIKRVDNIIRDVLCHASNTVPHVTATDIDRWLASLLDEVPMPEGIRLTKKLSCGAELPIDRERLRRCVVNVIDNACQAMSGNKGNRASLLTVETSVADGRVKIQVRDTGPGIPPGLREKVFEPLYSTKPFGVGLGLSIVKQIMEQHAGGVEVEGREGEGARVTLWLPRGEEEVQVAQASHSRCR